MRIFRVVAGQGNPGNQEKVRELHQSRNFRDLKKIGQKSGNFYKGHFIINLKI